VAAGATTLPLTSVTKFIHTCAGGGSCNKVFIAIGEGTDAIEVRQIASVNTGAKTVTLAQALSNDHAAGDFAGVEFTQYRWYPDVLLDNIFWHDHVDGIHNWGHGLVGQLIIEPKGSTYWDPQKPNTQVASGTIVDIHTTSPLVKGVVDGSFREMALWTIDENPNTDATLNLKADPWADRLAENPDPSLLFSSYTHGDPITPLPQAYPGDPLVIRTINVGPTVDGLHIDGHRFTLENRFFDASGAQKATQLDTLHYGISERYTLVLPGKTNAQPGDYLYENSVARKFRDGAWGLIRVLPGLSSNLLPLPGTTPPPAVSLPTQTGGRPPDTTDPGNPCPAGAPPPKTFAVSAVDLNTSGGVNYPSAAFVPTSIATAAKQKGFKAQPFVLHVPVGTCFQVAFTNQRSVRSSFHLDMVQSTPASSGVNAGFSSEQTVAPGGSRTYRFYADNGRYETGLISDYGGKLAGALNEDGLLDPQVDPGRDGMYGAVEVAPAGSTFTDPVTGASLDPAFGTQVDVHPMGKPGYRDFTVFLADQDPRIGQNQMPYPDDVDGPAAINYATAALSTEGGATAVFSSAARGGDPATPILKAYAGDPVVVHAIGAPGNEQSHVFSLGGLSWALDTLLDPNGDYVEARGLAPTGVVDAHIAGGAGGRGQNAGDYFYGDLRRPFTDAGMWGLQRVLVPSPGSCPLKALAPGVCP
jgi:hypothetical protein